MAEQVLVHASNCSLDGRVGRAAKGPSCVILVLMPSEDMASLGGPERTFAWGAGSEGSHSVGFRTLAGTLEWSL